VRRVSNHAGHPLPILRDAASPLLRMRLSVLQFHNVKQPSVSGPCLATRARRHCFSLPRGPGESFPEKYRGSGAPSDAPSKVSAPLPKGVRGLSARAACAGEPCCEQGPSRTRPTALHYGDFGRQDRSNEAPDRAFAHPASFRLRSSGLVCHLWRPLLVGPGGYPWPPGDGLRGTSAGAAPAGAGSAPVPAPLSCSANRTPHDGAPG